MSSHLVAPSRFSAVRAGTAVLCLIMSAPTAWGALDIVFVPTPTGNPGDLPAADMNGAKLADLLAYVETVYEDIIEDTFTITINYQYVANLSFDNGSFATTDTEFVDGGGRTTEGLLRIHRTPQDDPLQFFYYDPTPADDSEFDMVQWLYRDLTPTQQTNRFSNSTPDLFEAGYRGDPMPGSPCDDAMCTDLLTILFHEVGHGMGLTSKGGETGTLLLNETADATFDINPDFVNGQSMDIKVRGMADTNERSHVFGGTPNNFAIMSFNSPQTRRRPSATDIFTFASVSGWTDIDLRRQDFLGGTDWNTDGNWMGNQEPGSADQAWVRHGGDVTMSAGAFATTLTVDESSSVSTGANKLGIISVATIQGSSLINPSEIFVDIAGELETPTLVIKSGGQLGMDDGLTDVNDLSINAGGAVRARGTLDVANDLRNNGTLAADGAGLLTLTTLGFGVWDLDGTSGTGRVEAIDGSLSIQGSLNDAFDGTLAVGLLQFADFDTAWTQSGGRIELIGDALNEAELRGAQVTIQNDLTVADRGLISAPVIFGPSANVSVLGPDGRLRLTGPTQLNGGTYTGLEIQFDNTVNVNANTTLDNTITDLDGNLGNTITNINIGTLTINSDFIDDSNDFFDGTINVAFGAKLTVNVAASGWSLRGDLNLSSIDGFLTLPLSGKDVHVVNTGAINADGPVSLQAAVHLDGGSIETNDATTDVILTASLNTISGGSVNGPGELSASSGAEMRGFGTINTVVDFDGTAKLLADNGTLTVNGPILDVGTIGTDGISGVLNVPNLWNTNVANELRLNLGQVMGARITNGGATVGTGTIAAAGFINDGLLKAEAGGLIVNVTNVALLDLDGAGNAGQIEAVNGSIEIDNNFLSIQAFNGTLSIGNGQEFRMLFDGLNNTGQVTLTGGTYVAESFQQSGNMTVQTNPSFLNATSTFNPTSATTINADLNLMNDTTVEAGATLSGSAKLINNAGSHLQLKSGVMLAVDLQNDGTLEIGDSAGIADVRGNVTLISTSDLPVELEGSASGTFDRLTLTENLNLDGHLEVLLGRVFQPLVGDTFDIIAFDGLRTGVFASVGFPTIPEVGLGLLYNAQTVTLSAGILGDLNGDGFVGIEDLNIVLGVWNQNVDAGVWLQGDPSGDGFIGIEDLNVVLGNWNAGTPPAELLTNIPEPGTLVLLGVGGLGVLRRRVAC